MTYKIGIRELPLPKYERGDWVVHKHTVGYVEDRYVEYDRVRYSIYVPGIGVQRAVEESELTKIEHGFRPGDRVTFSGWAANCGNYTVTGEVTKLTSKTGLDIRDDKSGGIYGRSSQNVVKLEKPIKKPINTSDLPMPPKFDTLKTRTVTTTFTDVDPEVFKLLTGYDWPEPSKRIKEARAALDKQIKDAETELKKLKAARAAL
jgi:hypothetical protein